MTYLVYKHTSPSGKAYIGQTDNYNRRNIEHQAESSGCVAFKAAIDKYGWDSFIHEILISDLSLEHANLLEEQLISMHNTQVPNGYNLKPGGDNHHHNDVTKDKIRQKAIGRKMSDTTKHKKSVAMKGKQLTDHHIAQIKAALNRPDTKHKRSEAHTGMKWWTDGTNIKRARECPGPLFTPGRSIA